MVGSFAQPSIQDLFCCSQTHETHDIKCHVFCVNCVLRLASLTSAAFLSATSSFSWASFRASEYLSSSSSVPFSFFCICRSSSSCYQGEKRKKECKLLKICSVNFFQYDMISQLNQRLCLHCNDGSLLISGQGSI